jgi:hypothetical protein
MLCYNMRSYLGICLEGLSTTSKIFGQDNRSLCRDLQLKLPEHEAGVLPVFGLPYYSVEF